MSDGLRYFIYVKLPLFLIVLLDFLGAWFFKVYWVIEKAVTTSAKSIELNPKNILWAFLIGMIFNLILSVIHGLRGSDRVRNVNTYDLRQVVFMGLLFWVLAAGFNNSLRSAFYIILILALGELTVYARWGTQVGLSDYD
jgi:hypothetical protein